MSCITMSRLQCCCSNCNACGTAPALRRTASCGAYQSSACHSRRQSSRRQRGTKTLAASTTARAKLRGLGFGDWESDIALPLGSRRPERAQPRARRAVPFLQRGKRRFESSVAGRRHLVVAARRTPFLLGHLVVLPARFDQALVFELREGGIHGAAGQAGGGDHVEAVAGAGGQGLQDGNEGGTKR